jgi:O-antigen/teichoic acid export membrane protein
VVVNAVATFGFLALASRALGAVSAGAVFEGIAVFTIGSYAAMFGADVGILKLMPKVSREHPGNERRLAHAALIPSLVIGTIICIGLIVSRGQLAHLIVRRGNRAAMSEVIGVAGPFIPIGAFMSVATAGIRLWSIRAMVVLQFVLVPAARLVLLAWFLVAGLTPVGATIAWTVPLALGAITSYVYLLTKCDREHKDEALRGRHGPRSRVATELWRFSGPRSLAGIFQVLIAWLDVLFVGALASSRQSAAYAVASRYVVTGTFALLAMGFAIAPVLSRLFDRRDLEGAQRIYRESTWWSMAVTWPVLALMVIFSPAMMRVFGRGYVGGVVSLEILGLAMLVNTGTGNNAIALLMGGGNRENLGITALSLVLNVGLNLVLIPHLGAPGAAIAWAVSIMFTSIVTSVALHRRTSLVPFGRGYGGIVSSTVVAYGIVGVGIRMALGSGNGATCLGIALSSAVYMGIVVRFRKAFGFADLRAIVIGPKLMDASSNSGVE